MAAAAHDLSDDPFAGVLGRRRGGGSSHQVLPHVVNSPAALNECVRVLRAVPSLATSDEGAQGLRPARDYLATADHLGAAVMRVTAARDITDDTVIQMAQGVAVDALRLAADRTTEQQRTESDYDFAVDWLHRSFAAWAADQMLAIRSPSADAPPALMEVLDGPAYDQLINDTAGLSLRELHASARDSDALLSHGEWEEVMYELFRADPAPDVSAHIDAAYRERLPAARRRANMDTLTSRYREAQVERTQQERQARRGSVDATTAAIDAEQRWRDSQRINELEAAEADEYEWHSQYEQELKRLTDAAHPQERP